MTLSLLALIAALPLNQLTVLSSVAILGGLYFFVTGFRTLARKRLLLTTPASKIRSAAMGLVEINGLATGPYTMPAPVTGKPCFLYRTTVWQQSTDRNKEWEKVADETLHVPFFIDDSTGKLLIEPLGAELDLHRDFREEYDKSFFSSGVDGVPPRVSAFLSRHGVSATRSLRIEERLVKPGEPLFAIGTLAENPGVHPTPPLARVDTGSAPASPAESRPDAAPLVVRLDGGAAPSAAREMTQQSKIAAALTRAGITKPEAWAAAGVDYPGSEPAPAPVAVTEIRGTLDRNPNASADGQAASAAELNPPVVLMKGENDPAFVISYRSQKEVAAALAWKSTAMVWGGAAITLLGTYMLLAQMQIDWL